MLADSGTFARCRYLDSPSASSSQSSISSSSTSASTNAGASYLAQDQSEESAPVNVGLDSPVMSTVIV